MVVCLAPTTNIGKLPVQEAFLAKCVATQGPQCNATGRVPFSGSAQRHQMLKWHSCGQFVTGRNLERLLDDYQLRYRLVCEDEDDKEAREHLEDSEMGPTQRTVADPETSAELDAEP